jgi:lipopolysaccharide transport system ATP-binding protein
MSCETVIRLRRLAKKYPIYDRPSQKLAEFLTLRKRRFHREFWALRDIDLDVERGTTLGIIGPNGSGKSTLLQIIAGILRQTEGDCRVQGSVAALLELGAGFNPEFTGRENAFMNGAIMGLSQAEMEGRLDAILDFAEIGEFVDQPVKTYSSGMFVRLAFAVAIHLDPDVLLVDEALAVGDLIFQHRCVNRIRRLRAEGKTILFVTHDLQALTQFCDRAILLDGGRKLEDAGPEAVVHAYHSLIFEREMRRAGSGEGLIHLEEDGALPRVETVPHIHHRYGEGGAEIVGVLLYTPEGRVVSEVRAGDRLNLAVTARFRRDMENPIVGVTIRDRMGMEITATNSSYEGAQLPPVQAGQEVTVCFAWTPPPLRPGSYAVSPAVARGNVWEHTIEDWIDNAYIFDILDTGLVYGLLKGSFEVSYRRFETP